MAGNTSIAWTDNSWSPWWGCFKVSPGCQHCYADDLSRRYGYKEIWGPAATTTRKLMSGEHWAKPLRWERRACEEKRRIKVFPSMCDPFEDHPILQEPRQRLWSLIHETKHLDWLLLTKRPKNVMTMMPPEWQESLPHNIWIGTSVENQEWADFRIPELLKIPARVRFLSCEPLLGSVDLRAVQYGGVVEIDALAGKHGVLRPYQGVNEQVNWVIVGGESGPKYRPMHLDWARSIRDQCLATNTPFFFKQVGGRTPKSGGDLLDGQQWHEFPEMA